MVLRKWWSRLFPYQSLRTRSRNRRFRPRLEPLEDRTLLAGNLLFDPATGEVVIRGDAGDNSMRQTLGPDGFLEVTLDGQLHSSNPASPLFDQALAGATGSALAGIRFGGGGGNDTLILGSQNLSGSLAVSALDAVVVTEEVAVAGQLAIRARTITVSGTLGGDAVALTGTGWVTVEAGGAVAAGQEAWGGRIDIAGGVFVNSGRLHADGLVG